MGRQRTIADSAASAARARRPAVPETLRDRTPSAVQCGDKSARDADVPKIVKPLVWWGLK